MKGRKGKGGKHGMQTQNKMGHSEIQVTVKTK
jgi:hypothetical protein